MWKEQATFALRVAQEIWLLIRKLELANTVNKTAMIVLLSGPKRCASNVNLNMFSMAINAKRSVHLALLLMF